MSIELSSRRLFLKHSALGVSGALVLHLFPLDLEAAHCEANAAAASGEGFVFLSPEQASDTKAFAAQIFPTDDTPGSTEANVVYFIDRVLQKSSSETQEQFRHCLTRLNENAAELFPGTQRFSALGSEKQQQVIAKFETFVRKRRADLMIGMFGDGTNYFETLRTYVIAGFLSDPDDGGNKDSVGWQLIDFDGMGAHEPSFGFYDAELLKGGDKK